MQLPDGVKEHWLTMAAYFTFLMMIVNMVVGVFSNWIQIMMVAHLLGKKFMMVFNLQIFQMDIFMVDFSDGYFYGISCGQVIKCNLKDYSLSQKDNDLDDYDFFSGTTFGDD